jgi:3'(2'), 5'-bisphosphate nucleotidase
LSENPELLRPLLDDVIALARNAGDEILAVYAGDIGVRLKADESPVTDADGRAEAVILQGLASLTPGMPIVAEESLDDGFVPAAGGSFWLVDPLDGTKEFISRNGEFTVNIALVERGVPVLGVVYAPALNRLYAGGDGVGAFSQCGHEQRAPAIVRPIPSEGLVVVASRSHGDAKALDQFLDGRKVVKTVSAGSSLKFCLVATGEADLYPRLGRTMEWDTAAGHAVLRAAGGRVADLSGAELRYGKQGFANPHFVAAGHAFFSTGTPAREVHGY